MKLRSMLVALEVAFLSAAGCSFLKARSDPTRYFVLTASAPESDAPPPRITVGLERVDLPEYLIRPELVTRSGSNQLRIAEYDVWGEPIKDSFARTLRRDLERSLGATIDVAPFDPAAKPDLTVTVDVQRFERIDGEGAVLDARWTLRDQKRGTVVQGVAREQQAVAGADAQATVAALSRDVAALADKIASTVRAADRRRQEATRGRGAQGD